MSQLIAQMFQAGAVRECAGALLSFRYPSFTGKPEQNISTRNPRENGRRLGGVTSVIRSSSSSWRNALWLKVAQCSLVKCDAFRLKEINSRIRLPFYIFFLNPVYVAARCAAIT